MSQSGFECQAIEPVVVDTWLAGLIDVVGGLFPGLYRRLAERKRQTALYKPEDSTGFRIVARKRGQ